MNKLLDRLDALCQKYPNKWLNRETVTYLIFGVLTTLVNWICYYGLSFLGVNYLLSQSIAWVAAVIYAFITNKKYVFQSTATDKKTVMTEFWSFIGARLLTFLIETVILWLFVDKLGLSEMLMKIPASVLTVILNYVFSKLFIFKKKENGYGP